MSQLCFGTFAQTLQRALREDLAWWNEHIGSPNKRSNKNVKTQNMAGQHYVVVRLLDWVRLLPCVVSAKGKPLHISDAVASNWFNQDTELNSAIVGRIHKGDLDQLALTEFQGICKELIKYKVNDLLYDLSVLIENDPTVSPEQRQNLLGYCSKDHLAVFLAATFLYACCQPNKLRTENLDANDGMLVVAEGNVCRICAKQSLTKPDGSGTIPLFEAIDLPREAGSDEIIRVLVCAKCAKSKQFKKPATDKEPPIWDKLRELHETYELVWRLDEVYESNNLHKTIADVVEQLVERPTDETLNLYKPEDWEAKTVEKKIQKENWGLKEQIKSLADSFYFHVSTLFEDLDDGGKRRFERIRNQVAGCYMEAAEITDNQPLIFTRTCHWIARQAGVAKDSHAALIVAAFFVQNCEVFDEVS
ncbi:ABC-three component system protein [Propionimicrobium lymphophilum]|uniref:ABC-three component system protein n=1 Tax=Propionimicrobium lymphophilum TaxID=33012 RepID=UPI0023F206B6|nr:ABC-three component system protein [Propionimicrobium lymphophilum]